MQVFQGVILYCFLKYLRINKVSDFCFSNTYKYFPKLPKFLLKFIPLCVLAGRAACFICPDKGDCDTGGSG